MIWLFICIYIETDNNVLDVKKNLQYIIASTFQNFHPY